MVFNNQYSLSINGKMISAGKTFGVVNPATEEVFAEAPDASRTHLDEAVAAAKADPRQRETVARLHHRCL